MTNESALIFDIEAPFGFFKISEVTRATVSYPFTRTALIGLIGAILGRERNKYWMEKDPLSEALIALELINPLKHMALMVNYGHTKYTVNVARKLSTYLPSQSGKSFVGFVTNVRLDYLRDVHYRIYFTTEDDELYKDLKTRLINLEFEYPPYLGHANLLADIIYLGESRIKETKTNLSKIDSVIAVDYIDLEYLKMLDSRLIIVMDIPIKMYFNENKVVKVDQTGFLLPIKPGEPIAVKIKPTTKIYDVKFPDYTTDIKLWVSNREKRIAFMPIRNQKEKVETDAEDD